MHDDLSCTALKVCVIQHAVIDLNRYLIVKKCSKSQQFPCFEQTELTVSPAKKKAGAVGLEPTILRLTAGCIAIMLRPSIMVF